MTTTPEQRAKWKELCERHDAEIVSMATGHISAAKLRRAADAANAAKNAALKALPALISHVEALEAENARLKEALRPFGVVGDYFESETEGFHDDDGLEVCIRREPEEPFQTGAYLNHGDFRRARAAMGESE